MTPGTFNLVFAHQFQADERIIFRMKPGADSILHCFTSTVLVQRAMDALLYKTAFSTLLLQRD